MKNQIDNQIARKPWWQISEQLSWQLREPLWWQLSWQLYRQLWGQLNRQLSRQLDRQLSEAKLPPQNTLDKLYLKLNQTTKKLDKPTKQGKISKTTIPNKKRQKPNPKGEK